jgi:N-acetylglutamate synthase-like GNAT family acetyltransferase
VFRYPRWEDLDSFIEMHRTLSREKVMCRRLEMDRASGGRMLSEILVGLEEDRRSYLLVEREGALVGEGFTDKTGYLYCTVGIALVGRVRGLGIGTELMKALEQESRPG